MHSTPLVRKAVPSDANAILHLVDALADYEHLNPPDDDAKRRLVTDMFGDHPRLEVLLCEIEKDVVGYAFMFETYSSFLALPTLYLEDLFVLPFARRQRAGYALFAAVAREAHRRGCGRMEWTVLDWNSLAIDFYRKLGANHMKEWHLYRLTAAELAKLAGENGQ
ncbi:MAG: GNAT family N-acetyltransferase [Bacteroidota bacterium]